MATVREYRNRWVIDYRDSEGKRQIETIGPLTERVRRQAERQLRERLNQLDKGTLPSSRRTTFKEFVSGIS